MKNKSVTEWLTHYENLHSIGIDMGLERLLKVWQQLGAPKVAKKVITVAGTNGKGSMCKMMQLLLADKGLKVGCYTSPHLYRFNERISINGVDIPDAALVELFTTIDETRGAITITHFEASTLAALLYFSKQNLDVAILEVGLGGRLDAVNIIDADAAIISSIALDHESYLGKDLNKIALEKSGVFRAAKPAVFAGDNYSQAVVKQCNKENIPLLVKGSDYKVLGNKLQLKNDTYTIPVEIEKLGKHQVSNASGCFVLLTELGLADASDLPKLTKFSLQGRLEKIQSKPDIIIDVAHNAAAAKALAKYIDSVKNDYNEVVGLLAMLNDKQHAEVLKACVPSFDRLMFTSTSGERGFTAAALKDIHEQLSRQINGFEKTEITAINDPKEAYRVSTAKLKENDLLVIFGTFTIFSDLI